MVYTPHHWAIRIAKSSESPLIEQDGREDARTPGGPEARLAAAVERDCGWTLVAGNARLPAAPGAGGISVGSKDGWLESDRTGWPGRPHARDPAWIERGSVMKPAFRINSSIRNIFRNSARKAE
jgi:hypothetical protein